jgi:hypothetical protein
MSDYSQQPIHSPRTLKQRIMRRIYFVFMARNLSPFAFDLLAIVIVAFLATIFVSVNNVLENLSTARSSGNISGFSLTALSETELQTKLLLVVLGAIGFFAVRHLRRAWWAVKTLRQGAEESKR